MRIFIITAMFPPIQTVTSFYSKNLAETFQTTGHFVKVITTENADYVDIQSETFSTQSIPVLYISLKNYFKHLPFCSLLPKNFSIVNNVTKYFSSDVILL